MMDDSVIILDSDEEKSLLQKEADSSGERKEVKHEKYSPDLKGRKRKVKNEPVCKEETKEGIKDKIKEVGIKKRQKKEQLTSPKSKRMKIEPSEKKAEEVTRNLKLENKSIEKDTENLKSSSGEASQTRDKLSFGVEWKIENVIAEKLKLPSTIVKNIVRLLESDNTIPFIARYRKEQTGNMEPETLRHVKDNYERLTSVKQKINSVASSIIKMNKMTPAIETSLRSSQTLNEIEHIYAEFKPSGAHTLAGKARALGLEEAAVALLEGTSVIRPENLVNEKTKSLTKVLEGLQHIIADIISKNQVVLSSLKELCEQHKYKITLEAKKSKATEAGKEKKSAPKEKNSAKKPDEDAVEKFQLYFSFRSSICTIKPHQVLAILRGESLKVLTVKINIPEWFLPQVKNICKKLWISKGKYCPTRQLLLPTSIEDSYKRLLQPYMVRQIRSELTEEAHLASIDVFARNLKHLLLTPPVRGKVVMGIDPGYKHGCKVAVVNSNGEVLTTNVLYLHSGGNRDKEVESMCSMLCEYGCELIALGNGTACRETETWLSSLISKGCFKPLEVKYTIVDEQGVSIYSCSPTAKEEFPKLEPNIISAISLARRVQDPLSEFVKVEPKHLGVGMYQHDIPEKKLSCALDEVVVECVSFVGVDVNTASGVLLRHVAGLSSTRAGNIIEWRNRNGPFMNRDQLHLVKGIGPKSFEQCAGFLRIISETSTMACFGDQKSSSTSKMISKKSVASESTPNPLDQTWIHPESYATVYWLLELCGLSLSDFGKFDFTNKIQRKVEESGFKNIACTANISEERLKLILEGLSQKPDHDIRSKFHKPLFRQSICTINDLTSGSTLTGRVQNVTHFGAFVDIGVGRDGLIHISQMKNAPLQVGSRVEVIVRSMKITPKCPKIELGLVRIL